MSTDGSPTAARSADRRPWRMKGTLPLVTRVATALEGAAILDRPAGTLNSAVAALVPRGWARSALSGSWLGHPAHPFLVTVPIGCWSAASLLDLVGEHGAARTMIGAGVVSALPVAMTGASDWVDTAGAERRVGLTHAAVNTVAAAVYSASWWARRRSRPGLGVGLALAGAGIATFGGWLGGHLAYALGVGVDTNAFETGPESWSAIDLDPEHVTDRPARAEVSHVALLVTRHRGRMCVLADRCSHRGGPLSGGEIRDGAVACPWHGSRFDLVSGEVREGPAVASQPVYEVRSVGTQIEVRRDEPRALRANATRPGSA